VIVVQFEGIPGELPRVSFLDEAKIQRILWDVAEAGETAPSLCFMADRSCCLAALREAIAK